MENASQRMAISTKSHFGVQVPTLTDCLQQSAEEKSELQALDKDRRPLCNPTLDLLSRMQQKMLHDASSVNENLHYC